MTGNECSPWLYVGTTGIARPGDPVPPGSQERSDRATALADAWAEAEETGRVPHVYQVSDGIISAAVLPSGAMAWAALTARRRGTAETAPEGGSHD